MSTLSVTNIKNPSASTAAITLAADGSMTGSFPAPNRNLLYNGAMQVAQRGTSSTGITSGGYYTADRWQHTVGSLGTWTQTVENDAPTGSGLSKSLKVLCTTADSAPAAADSSSIIQALEGQDLQRIAKGTSAAQPLTLSFWVKSNVTGTYVAVLQDSNNARQVGAQYSVSASATWEKKTITFPADTTGVFNNDNAASLFVRWWLGAGTDRTSGTLRTSWTSTTTADLAVGQTNLAAATNNYWQITGVQLEVGAAPTAFEFKSYGQELRECQRYYEKSYNETTTPGTVIVDGCSVFDNVGGGTRIHIRYATTKRTNPGSVTFYSPYTGATGKASNGTTDYSTASPIHSGSTGFGFDTGVVPGGAIGFVHWTASAEL